MKNQKFGSLAYLVVAVLTLVCLVIYVMNANAPYYEDMNASVVVMLVVALAAVGATLYLPQNTQINKIIVDLCRVVAAALIIYAAGTFVSMRVESFGYIYGSNLELGNQQAFDAGGQAIALIVVFIINWIISLVAAFLEVGKKN